MSCKRDLMSVGRIRAAAVTDNDMDSTDGQISGEGKIMSKETPIGFTTRLGTKHRKLFTCLIGDCSLSGDSKQISAEES